MDTKSFSLRTILTVTTGRLLTKGGGDRDNGIGDLYKILDWMTGDNLFTHQLPRAGEECRPWLLKWFPELAPCSVGLSKLDEWISKSRDGTETGIIMWLAEQKMMFPALKDFYDVPQIPSGHVVKDPMEELIEMRGGDHGIIPVVI